MLSNDRLASTVASHGEGGAPGMMGVQHWVGGQQRGGGGGNSGDGESTRGMSSSNNRPSHHKYKYKSPKQFKLKQS